MTLSWPPVLVFATLAAMLSPSASFSLGPNLALGAVKPFRSAMSPAVRGEGRFGALRMVEEQDMCGTWSLQQNLDDKEAMTFFLTLIEGGTVELPPSELLTKRDTRVRWSCKEKDFYLEVPKRSLLSSSSFDRSYTGIIAQEGDVVSGVAGSILDGEDEPEYSGKFSMKLIMRAASKGGGGFMEDGEWNGEVDENVHFDDV
mmetsp:Transcript_12545/g.30486  ORF Transcript_12545/g.30486 Transcript_12545/m.30486 type:complete len:201 (+) Transcript_12545:60-662(+)|eukprot:CAMPEP_0180163846 /NCGR_PEP_ID=MMETSP0986-20121125/30036_1 /TAXON_ID=697907 /ORGANISM="non described non described, Strain CCMP2293" /LENGTH=200 /DNA_ID=CAMNT_0022114547 /DNA_START=38 /DNA_END=640 /DNA_ORIENTATION=-